MVQIVETSRDSFEFRKVKLQGMVTVCYALNTYLNLSKRDPMVDGKIIQCICTALDGVRSEDVRIVFTDYKHFTEMKVIVDVQDTTLVDNTQRRLLGQRFLIRLNEILMERGLEQYTVRRSYLEDDRNAVIREYEESKRVTVTDEYNKMDEEEQTDWWMYGLFCCAFLLWFIPLILCAILLMEVHELDGQVNDLTNHVIFSDQQSSRALDLTNQAWTAVNGSASNSGSSDVNG